MASLAEIIEEGERLLDHEHYHTQSEMGGYLWQHGPRLLAVAKAAVEMRRSVTLAQEREWAAKLDALIEDAAVRGEEEKV